MFSIQALLIKILETQIYVYEGVARGIKNTSTYYERIR